MVKCKYYFYNHLDLSFNNIEKIDGLQNLVNLEDLTLYNNRITTLENMENLKKLQVFSIGNNYITELSNVSKTIY